MEKHLKGTPHGEWFTRAMGKTDIDVTSGCWLYRGEIVHNGYGRIWHKGKNSRVHRLSYELFCDEIPKSLMVCHRCDVRHCWNPSHLFLGTAKDNFEDAVAKGRVDAVDLNRLRRVKAGRRFLTEENVREIRGLISSKELTYREIGARYGVTKSAIQKIKGGLRWSSLS